MVWATGLLILTAFLAAYGVSPSWLITVSIAAIAAVRSFLAGTEKHGRRFVLGLAIIPAAAITGLAVYATASGHMTLFDNLPDIVLSVFGKISGGIVGICGIAALVGYVIQHPRRHDPHDGWYDKPLDRYSRE
jgi:hypothetical protein